MLAVEIPFLIITTVIVILSYLVDFGQRFKMKYVHEARFYMYVLYIVAIILTILRMITLNLIPAIPSIYFTIIYNWAASLIVVIGSISPGRIGYAVVTKNYGMLTKRRNKTLTYVLWSVAVYLLLLVATIAVFVIGSGFSVSGMSAMAPLVTLVWRVIFMSTVIFEIACFTMVQVAIQQQNRKMGEDNQLQLSPNLLLYFKITPVIHTLIAITILLKYVNQVSTEFLFISHMLFIIAGLAAFAIKLQRAAGYVPGGTSNSESKAESASTRNKLKSMIGLAGSSKQQRGSGQDSSSSSSSYGSANSSSDSSSSTPIPSVDTTADTPTSSTSSPPPSPTLGSTTKSPTLGSTTIDVHVEYM